MGVAWTEFSEALLAGIAQPFSELPDEGCRLPVSRGSSCLPGKVTLTLASAAHSSSSLSSEWVVWPSDRVSSRDLCPAWPVAGWAGGSTCAVTFAPQLQLPHACTSGLCVAVAPCPRAGSLQMGSLQSFAPCRCFLVTQTTPPRVTRGPVCRRCEPSPCSPPGSWT